MFELAQVAVMLVLLPIMLVVSAIRGPIERPAAAVSVEQVQTLPDLPLAEPEP